MRHGMIGELCNEFEGLSTLIWQSNDRRMAAAPAPPQIVSTSRWNAALSSFSPTPHFEVLTPGTVAWTDRQKGDVIVWSENTYSPPVCGTPDSVYCSRLTHFFNLLPL